MKVFYVASGLNGCFNVRCLLPLVACGFDGDRTTLNPNQMTPEDKAKACSQADIVVFHRPEQKDKLEAMRLLKQAGKKIVFDNDDTYKDHGGFKFNEYMDEKRLEHGLGRLNDTIDTFIKEADLITCTTKFLKEEYEKINPNVVILPNCVDPFYFPEPNHNETDIVRIGITGSVGITSDIEVLKPILEHYNNDPRVRIVLLSMPPDKENELFKQLYKDEYAFWDTINMEWHPLVEAHLYYEYLNDLKLDMVIIPRYDSLFNRCKSNLKFLENSMLSIPSICQSFSTGDSPYEQNPADKDYLLLATDTESWIAQMETLITNKELRRELGKKAHDYVLANYNIEDHAHEWVDAYQKLLTK
jgi:glycosyltransferase involved in cell wall biosynthesis